MSENIIPLSESALNNRLKAMFPGSTPFMTTYCKLMLQEGQIVLWQQKDGGSVISFDESFHRGKSFFRALSLETLFEVQPGKLCESNQVKSNPQWAHKATAMCGWKFLGREGHYDCYFRLREEFYELLVIFGNKAENFLLNAFSVQSSDYCLDKSLVYPIKHAYDLAVKQGLMKC